MHTKSNLSKHYAILATKCTLFFQILERKIFLKNSESHPQHTKRAKTEMFSPKPTILNRAIAT